MMGDTKVALGKLSTRISEDVVIHQVCILTLQLVCVLMQMTHVTGWRKSTVVADMQVLFALGT